MNSVALTLVDDETLPQVILAVDDDTILESETGATAVRVTATLDPAVMVSAEVVVMLDLAGTATAGGSGDYTAAWSPAAKQIRIPAGEDSGSAAVTLTLTPRQDDVAEGDETIVVQGRAVVQDAAMGDLVVQVATVTLVDDDEPGVVVTPRSLEVPEGESRTYSVVLASQPSADATVGMTTVLTGTDVIVDPDVLTFTTMNWNAAQTVTVTAEEDDDAEADDPVTLTHTVSGGDYASVAVDDVVVTIVDDDTAGLVLSPPSLTVAEGDAASYTVTLATEPSGPVTVTISGTASTDLSLDETSLTFTASNWNAAQTVTVTAGEDDDGATDTATLVHTASGGDYAAVTADLAVTVTDDDTAGIVLSPPTLSVAEGGEATYTVALSTQPSAPVTVSITGQAGTDLTLDETSLTFTASNWSTAQMVTVTAGEDDDGATDTATLVHTASGGDYGSVTADLAVTVTDDDTAGIVLSPPTLSVAEGGEATYTVVLATQPSAPVTVSITGQAGTDLTLDTSSLTFTASNWSTAQMVTVTAGEDDDAIPDDPVTLAHEVSGGDYAGVMASSVEVTIVEDDEARIDVKPLALTIVEGGIGSYQMQLNTQPSAAVTVSITGQAGTDLTLDTSSLTFTASNWNAAQTVTVTAGEDDDAIPDDPVTLAHEVSGGDYAGVMASSVEVTIVEDDEARIDVKPLALTIVEGGIGSYQMQLNTQPSAAVTVSISLPEDADLSLSRDSLTFTPSDYFRGQVVVVDALHDDDAVDDPVATISHEVSGGDYNELAASGVRVTITEDDTAALAIRDASAEESAGSMTFTVRLDVPSSKLIRVNYRTSSESADSATAGADYRTASGAISFPAGETEQTITVATVDDAVDEVDETFTVTLFAPENATLAAADGTATGTITDDDTPSFTLSVSAATIAEAGGTSTVTLATGGVTFASDETITLSLGGTAAKETDYTIGAETLTLTVGQTEVTTTVTAVQDTVDDDAETIVVTASRGESQVGAPQTITITDDDTPSFTLSVSAATIAEAGGTSTVTLATGGVTLLTDETITLSLGGTAAKETDYTIGAETLTLTVGQTEVTTTVTAVQDTVDDDAETIVVTASRGGSQVGAPQTITITDDDTPSFTLSVSAATIAEAGGTSTVTLATGGVTFAADETITLSLGGTAAKETDYTIGAETLTLTAGQTEVTTTVTAVQDTVDDDAETVVVTASRGGSQVGAPQTITITDDDTPSFTLSVSAATIAEAGGTSTVTLATGGVTFASDETITLSLGGTAAKETDYTIGAETLTLTVGQTEVTTTVTAVQDTVDDDAETIVVTASRGESQVGAPQTITITDDDTPSFTLSVSAATIAEAGGTSTVTLATGGVTLLTDETITLSLGGTAAKETDYTIGAETLTLTVGQTEVTTTVTAVQDTVDDDAETIVVTASRGGSQVGAPQTITITDDDTPSFTLSVSAATIAEAGGTSTVTLATGGVTFAADETITLSLGGTAAKETDYTIGAETLTLTAGQTEVTTTVTAVQDTVDDDAETVVVTASRGGSQVGAPQTITITDDDTPSFTLSVSAATIAEAGGTSTVTLATGGVTFASDETITLSLGGTAAKETDYTIGAETLTLTVGQTEVTTTVTAVQDTVDDDAETIVVTASRGESQVGAPQTITITDDDTASSSIALSLNPTRVTEPGGEQTVTVTAMLNAGARTADTLVNVTVAGDTATVGDDFGAVSTFSITIPATEVSATGIFSLTPVDDASAEGDETLQVSGASPLPVTPATLTLADDDIASSSIALSLDPDEVTEQGGRQTVTITAMLNAGTRTADTVVNVSVAGLTATEVEDFAAVSSFNVTIPANQASATGTFSLTPVNDGIAEGEETLQVRGTATGLTVNGATLTISDDDTASSSIALSLDPDEVTEQGGRQTVTVTAVLNAGARTADTLVNVTVAGLTATVVEDFAAVEGFQITIPATQTNGQNSFSLTPVNDAIAEGDETLQVSGIATGLTVDPATLTISDDDMASTRIELTLDPQQITEQGGRQTVRVTAMLNAGTRTQNTVVQVSVAGLTATVMDDFAAVPSFNVTIPANQPSGEADFSLTPVNDAVAEGEETLQVSGASPLPVTPATLTLADDDTASTGIALTLDPQQITEQGGRQTVRVTAMLNAGTRTQNTVVRVTVAGLTATVVEDFAAVSSFNVTIPANQASGQNTFSLTPVNDAVAEGEETLQVRGTATGLTVDGATLTISDDDTASSSITLSLDPQRVSENGGPQTVTVTAMLNAGARTQNTVVQVTVAGDTATAVEDFATVSSFNVTIPANQASGQNTFSLTPVNDAVAEGEETLTVSAPSPLPVTPATLILADDDTASTGIALTLDPQQITEQGGRQTVRVTAMLNAGTRTQNTVVRVTVAGLTATAVDDFAAVSSFNVTIPANQPSGEADFSVTPVNDAVAEGDETLTVSGTATGLTVDGATLTISDDDTASTGIALTLDPQQITEQGGRQTVRVTAMLNAGTRTQNTVVRVTVAGLTATAVDDFAAVSSFNVTIPANQPSGEADFSVTPVNDAVAEGEETLQVRGTATGLTVDGATLTISDDDTASTGIALTLDPQQITEQGGRQTVRVTAMLNAGTRTQNTVVRVTVAGLTATAVDDFAAVSSFHVTIPANQASGQNTFSLTPVNDAIAEGDETLQVSGIATGLTVDEARLTLGDDDTVSTRIELMLDPDEITEQGGRQTVTVTAMLNAGARTQNTVVRVTVAGDTATVVDDFGAVPSFHVTIPATQASGENSFSLTPVNDAIAEGDETLQVSGIATGLAVDGATLTLGDDDTASTRIELMLDPTRVTEDGGAQTVTVTAMLNAGTRTAATVVNVTVAGNTATVGDDFVAVSSFHVTIPANQLIATGPFLLTPVNDGIAEGDETLQVSGTATGLTVGGATLTIIDSASSDPPPPPGGGGFPPPPPPDPASNSPTADAGPDQTGVREGALVTLDGSGSSDPDDDPLRYRWNQSSGESVVLSSRDVANPTFTAPQGLTADAVLSFRLLVTDPSGRFDSDTVTVTVEQGSSLPPVTEEQIYYFSHLAVGEGWQTTLTYINYSPQEVNCRTEFLSDQGTPLLVSFAERGTVVRWTDVLPPGGSVHEETNVELSSPLARGWARATCSGPLKASLLYRRHNSAGMPTAEAGVNAAAVAATRFVTFAEQEEGQFGTGVAYANPSTTSATVTFTARDAAGQVLASVDQTLSPGGHDAKNMVDLFDLSSFSGSLEVTSPAPIVSLSLNVEADPVFSSLPPGELHAAAPGSTTYYFPHLAVGESWQTTITYINYSPQEVSCQTEFLSDHGSPLLVSFAGLGTVISRSDTLPPGGSVHQETNVELSAPLARGWARATCTGPLKASLLYRRRNSAGVPTGEAGVNAVTIPARRFVTFAEQGEGRFGTGVAYANPSDTAALVTFTARDAAGQTLTSVDQTLLPNGHDAQNMVDLFDLTSFTGSLEVTSTEPIVSLSLNVEADPVFSSLPPGEVGAAAQGATLSSQTAMPTTATTPDR